MKEMDNGGGEGRRVGIFLFCGWVGVWVAETTVHGSYEGLGFRVLMEILRLRSKIGV
jgi:hypothetical protein